MSTLAARIRSRMRTLGITQEDLSERAGISQTAVSKIVTGKTLRPRRLIEIAEVLQTTPRWLLDGKEEQRPQESDHSHDPRHPSRVTLTGNNEEEPAEALLMLDLSCVVSLPAAGEGKQEAEFRTAAEGRFPLPRSLFDRRGLNPEECRLLTVSGSAMAPALLDGDLILVDTSQHTIVDGETYVVFVGGETYVRRVFRVLPDSLRLDPYNPTHTPATVPRRDAVILGRVVFRAG